MTSSLMRISFSETVIRGRIRRGLYDWYVINASGIQLGATAEVGS